MKKILGVLAVGVAGLCGVAAMQPDDFHVERSAEINAPAAAVFTQVNDLEKWQGWSPWVELDPNAKNEFSATKVGKDASMSWDGNSQVGKGTLTITDSVPNEKV